jgi:hypothetical protein
MASLHSSTSTFRKVLVAAGAFALGGGFAAASIEVGMRVIGYGQASLLAYGRDHYNPGLPEIGYAGRPNVHGIQTREGVSEVKLNSHGFNDVEHSQVPPPGTFRIAVIGNSFSMAVQVARADGFVSRLGDELTHCSTLAGRKVETINLGVDGYTIDQHFLVLRDYGLSLSPDFVLMQTNGFASTSGDFSPRVETRPSGEVFIDRIYLDEPEFKRRASELAGLIQDLSDRSRLLQYILEYRRVSAKSTAKDGDEPVDPQAVERSRKGRDLVFNQLAELLRARKISWAMTIVPTADSMSFPPFHSNPVHDDWLKLAASADVPVFDVEEEARAQVRATKTYLHGFGGAMTGGHLNRSGNAFFAKALATRLCEFLGTQSANAQRRSAKH